MKTTTYFCCTMVWLLTLNAQAQTEKYRGFWTGGFGGQLSSSRQFENNSNDLAFQLFVSRGVFIRKNVLLGAELSAQQGTLRTKAGYNFDTRSNRFTLNTAFTPFIRRYWGPQGKSRQIWRVYLGAGLSAGWERTVTKAEATGQQFVQTHEDAFRLSPELQAGFVYFINRYWGVEAITRSTTFPLTIANLGVGLILTTGNPPVRPIQNPVFTPNQLMRGNWLVAGGFLLSSSNRRLIPGRNRVQVYREETNRGVSVNPAIGYLVGNRLVVGVAAPLSYNVQKLVYADAPEQDPVRVEKWSAGVQPFVKKYFTNRRLTPYAAAQLSWEWSDDGFVTDTYNAQLSAGLAYLIGTRFILEGQLVSLGGGWTRTRNDDRRETFGDIGATLRPGFTLSYVFL